MKNYSIFILAFLCASCTKTDLKELQSPNLSKTVPANLITLDELRILNVAQDSIYKTKDFSGGEWKLDPTDTTSPDNTGTIVVTKKGKRLKRLFSKQVNLTWFGAITNGMNATSLIQSAINASQGAELIIPAGTYVVDRLTVISDIKITGVNAKFKMVKTSQFHNMMFLLNGVQNVEISGLDIDLTGVQGSMWMGTSGIEIKQSKIVRIHNNYIHNNTYIGVRLGDGNDNILIDSNIIENTDTGIHVNNQNTNLTIRANIIKGGTSEGITVYGYANTKMPTGFVIEGNTISNKVYSFGINIPYAKNGIIRNNTIYDCKGGVLLYDLVSVYREGLYSHDLLITQNEIHHCDWGIKNVGYNTTVSDNLIRSIKNTAIIVNGYLNLFATTTGVSIINNTIDKFALVGSNLGMGGILAVNTKNSTIFNNKIINATGSYAIRFDGSCDSLNVMSNYFPDGIISSSNKIYDKSIIIRKNKLKQTYFPIIYPITYNFKLVCDSNTYTSDITTNTVSVNGVYYAINSTRIMTNYYVANNSVIDDIVSSWENREITLFNTGWYFYVSNNNRVALKNNKNVTVPPFRRITLKFTNNKWVETYRNF